MSKIKIGAQVTAKVRHTNVTVSGTFQGYELEDQEDPTSVCGKVFYVKDGMQHLDYVYVDSIKVCKGEDEDERIRRCIEVALTDVDEQRFKDFGTTLKECIAYLEKQKEQERIVPVREATDFEIEVHEIIAQARSDKRLADKDVLEQFEKEASCALMWKAEKQLRNAEKQKEQKPECDNETEVQKAYREGKNAGRKEVLDHPEYYGLQLRRMYDYETGERNPEWSEEDERTLESFLGWLQGSMGEKTYSSWLKSLPERFSLKPKQEWSEEDENIYNKALDAIYYKDCNEKDDVISALNDLCDLISRKRKVIPPYAHWKPSKEQMEALLSKLPVVKGSGDKVQDILESLYNDLKKLM